MPGPRILNEDPGPSSLTCGVRIADPGPNVMKDPCGLGSSNLKSKTNKKHFLNIE
jgi:hypothetical protein